MTLLEHKRGAEIHFGEGNAGAVYVCAVSVGGDSVPNFWR